MGGRDNRLSTGPGYVPGTGTARFRCDCALGPLYAWSGPMKLPVMLRVLMGWLGERLQRPRKAEHGRAWIGAFLDISRMSGTKGWAPWAFVKGDTKKVIAALELLATLIGVRLWVPEGQAKQHPGSYQRIYGQPVQ